MKRFLLLLPCLGAIACAADLAAGRNVYVLGMSRGLDQYLANHLTSSHVLQVVTDPKLADVVLTDHLGDAFQAQLEAISPSPEPEDTEPEPAKTEEKKADAGDTGGTSFLTPPVNKLDNPALNSTFGRNKGNIFLVDAKSRHVIWSVFEPPKGASVRDLDHTAGEIVSRLKKDLHKK